MSTNSKIHAAADELFEQHSKRPTIAQIRDYMGSGSFSTITKAMQTWQQPGAAVVQATEPAAAAAAQEGSKEVFDPNAVPTELQSAVMTAVQQVWTTAKTEADERIAQIQAAAAAQAEALQAATAAATATAEAEAEAMEAEHQAVVDELCAEVDRHEADAEEKSQTITKMQSDIEGLGERINLKIDALEVATAQIKRLEEQLNDKNAVIEDMKKQLDTATSKAEKLTGELAAAQATTAAAEKLLSNQDKKLIKCQEDNNKLTERAAKAEGRIQELEKQLKAITDAAKTEKHK